MRDVVAMLSNTMSYSGNVVLGTLVSPRSTDTYCDYVNQWAVFNE